MKMRVSLSHRGDEIRGTVELPADPAFVLEGLAVVIERVAAQYKVTEAEAVQDLYTIVTGRAK